MLANRRRERLEKISEAVGAVFEVVKNAQVSDGPPIIWTAQRNRVEEALAVWDGPEMNSVLNLVRAGTALQALMFYSAARGDITGQFFLLDQQK